MNRPDISWLLLLGVALPLVLGPVWFSPRTGAEESQPLIPFSESEYTLEDPLRAYNEALRSGGPPKDGIPSIDDPKFISSEEADLAPEARVIGLLHNGEARAYPQHIMVYHEIVNDSVQGENLAITYCPLTATAQGFKRGNTTFGVSGDLLNSNLVMYDRRTDSYFSQIIATGLRGDHRGEGLVELNLIWTTWKRWREAHPETAVLSEETGYLRNYDRDPYGSYNPRSGYYASKGSLFPLMRTSDELHAKEMVVGARTTNESARFVLEKLRRDRVQETEDFLAIYDSSLDTGYIYLTGEENPDVRPVEGNRYRIRGTTVQADELPFNKLVSVEAFHFAWHAFYPSSQTP